MTHELTCLLSVGVCCLMSKASAMKSLYLLCSVLMMSVFSVRCFLVSVVWCSWFMCCLGAPSLKCMVRRRESDVVVAPM